MVLQSKRVGDSAPALQGGRTTAPVLLGEGVHLDPKAASISITLRFRNSGFSEPGPLLPSPEKKQTQIQVEVGLGISPFASLSPTADPQALSPEESQSYMGGQVGSWAWWTCLSQHRAFPSRSPEVKSCPSVGHHLSYGNVRTLSLSPRSPNLHPYTVIQVGMQPQAAPQLRSLLRSHPASLTFSSAWSCDHCLWFCLLLEF